MTVKLEICVAIGVKEIKEFNERIESNVNGYAAQSVPSLIFTLQFGVVASALTITSGIQGFANHLLAH